MEFNMDTSRHRQEEGGRERERTMQSNRCVDWPACEEEMKHKNGKREHKTGSKVRRVTMAGQYGDKIGMIFTFF